MNAVAVGSGEIQVVAPCAAEVVDLTVHIDSTRRGAAPIRVLHQVDLALPARSITALIGESGCGKSMLASALTGLLPAGSHAEGIVRIGAQELGLNDRAWSGVRGRQVGLVPQGPATSFTPVRTLRSQLNEVIDILESSYTAKELCDAVGLGHEALGCYPHELSGGMAQRAAVAAAIAGDPAVIVADEPTSALDPALAHGIWELLADRARSGAAVLVISHDMDSLLAADVCSSIAVMRAGEIVTQQSPDACASDEDRYVADFFVPVR